MSDMVFLNDIFIDPGYVNIGDKNTRRVSLKETSKWSFWSRYLGPYTVASSVRTHFPDMSVVVVDYFTKIPDFFDYIRAFVNEDTKYICISTTFLQNLFNVRVNDFNLWFRSHDETFAWFEKLKSIAPNAKVIISEHEGECCGTRIQSVFR